MSFEKVSGLSGRLFLTVRLVVVAWLWVGPSVIVSLTAGLADNPSGAGPTQPDQGAAAERIDALRAEIARHDELYFKKSAPAISDAAYDQLKRELAALERAFPHVSDAAGQTHAGVGDDRSGSFAAYRHRERMLSLNKSYTESELRAFDARLMKQLGRSELDYVVEPKFDGLAISVTFEKGRLVRAVTRGNGKEGDDVTANLLTIHALPRLLGARAPGGETNPVPDLIELRGEVYLTFAEFERINRERENAGEPLFANPRNLAAGTLKQSDANEVAKRKLSIVFYGMGSCEPAEARPDSQQALLRQLHEWDLPTIEVPRFVRGADAMWKAVQAVGGERGRLGFPIDGAVVKLNAVALQDRLGATEEAPLWAIAYKFVPEQVETRIRAITLQVGRTGVITPVAELLPVKVGGSTIARASLFNREEIARRDIRVGDFVSIEKAGEIIPTIAKVNRARRTPDVKPYVFPSDCPACHTLLIQSAGEAAIRCPNFNCPVQIRRRVEHFASAACVGITGLGPAMVEKLVGKGWVTTVADLYRLRREDLLTLGANGKKSTDRLLAAIEQSKHAELWRFIYGLGIPHVGTATARELARSFGSLELLARARREDFAGNGRTAKSDVSNLASIAIVEYFARPESQHIVASLQLAGVQPRQSQK